jgi:hypothetical protein
MSESRRVSPDFKPMKASPFIASLLQPARNAKPQINVEIVMAPRIKREKNSVFIINVLSRNENRPVA